MSNGSCGSKVWVCVWTWHHNKPCFSKRLFAISQQIYITPREIWRILRSLKFYDKTVKNYLPCQRQFWIQLCAHVEQYPNRFEMQLMEDQQWLHQMFCYSHTTLLWQMSTVVMHGQQLRDFPAERGADSSLHCHHCVEMTPIDSQIVLITFVFLKTIFCGDLMEHMQSLASTKTPRRSMIGTLPCEVCS